MNVDGPAPATRGAADLPSGLPAELRLIASFCDPAGPCGPWPAVDWAIVARGLERHGLTRLVPAMLAVPGLVPAEVAPVLQKLQRDRATAALVLTAEAVRIAEKLDAAGVRFLLIKGLALSIQLFDQPTVRSSNDLDLLVEPGAGPRVDSVLASLGYVRPAEDRAKGAVAGYEAKEIGHVHRDTGMLVEIHARLTDNEDLFAPDFESLWEARETLQVGGQPIATMGRGHLPTYLAAHGAKHSWSRLMWLVDLAALTGTPAAIDEALADARQYQLEPMMLHTLSMLHRWLGHPVPPAVLAQARASSTVRLLDRMAEQYHRDPRWYETAPRRSWRRFYQQSVLGRVTSYAMKPRMGYWRRQMSIDLVSPADRTIVALPPHFAWGYAVLRPFGWLIRRIGRRSGPS